MNAQEWLLNFVQCYRELGFFEEHSQATDEEVAGWIKQKRLSQGLDLEQESCREDYLVIDCDSKRVWGVSFDLFESFDFSGAQDLGYGGRLHEDILNAWARISRSLFVPESVKAVWPVAEEAIRVEFVVDGQVFNIELESDAIDEMHYGYELSTLTKLATALTPFMERTGSEFKIWDLGCAALVLCVTPEEAKKLVELRGVHLL
jgi:hypothetical protein